MLDVPHYKIQFTADGRLAIQAKGGETAIQHKFSLQADPLGIPFGRKPAALLDDLVTVASTVYAIDRLIRRNCNEERGIWSWQRRLEVEIPVSQPERWNQAEVRRLLSESLNFFTEDLWEITFCPRETSRQSDGSQMLLFTPDTPQSVALFSGGLDSFAGLVIQLVERNVAPLVTITCSTNSRISRKQRQLLKALRGRTAARLVPIYVCPRLSHEGRDYNLNERSQRARGFLFHSLGVVAALTAGAEEVLIYENGIGSINLPLSEAQLGAQSTRATSPVALYKLERFFRALLGQQIRLRLPFLFMTKGEMCEQLKEFPLRGLALETISCDGFPQRQKGPEQCGLCTSCLLRRVSLWASGFSEDCLAGRYRYDVLGDTSGVSEHHMAPLLDMLLQVSKLERALSAPSPWQELTIEFPELQEVRDVIVSWHGCEESAVERKMVDLYRRYCWEWESFPARPFGWHANPAGLRLTA